MAANNIGKITQIVGAVLDIKFTAGNLPEINTAIRINRSNGEKPRAAKSHQHTDTPTQKNTKSIEQRKHDQNTHKISYIHKHKTI